MLPIIPSINQSRKQPKVPIRYFVTSLALLLVSLLGFAQTSMTTGDVVGKWQNENGGTWRFTEWQVSDTISWKKFIFQDEDSRLAGDWALNGEELQLNLRQFNYNDSIQQLAVEQGMAMVANIDSLNKLPQDSTRQVQIDSLMAAMPSVLPFPTRAKFQYALSSDKKSLDLSLNSAIKGQAAKMKLSSIQPSGFAQLLSNRYLRGILGIVFLIGMAWLFSTNRKAIRWQQVGIGLSLQLAFAIIVLKVDAAYQVLSWISGSFVTMLSYASDGAAFLFAGLVTDTSSFGYIFAFQVLPVIVFFAAVSSILYYLGILQRIVFAFAWVMNKTMKLSGAESLAAAANIFIGQTEAPLVVKPYLKDMTRSEMMTLMCGGMATIAGSVFAAYVLFLGQGGLATTFATHLLTASIISAPAAIVAAKILVPETDMSALGRAVEVPTQDVGTNLLDAIAKGTTDGLRLMVNVAVMLMVFLSLIALVNGILGYFGAALNLDGWIASSTGGTYSNLSLEYLFGIVFSPLAWIMGVPSEDIMLVGQLLGEKTIANEFVAYASMGAMKDSFLLIDKQSLIIATYALCGFSNISSIGILIGGIGSLAPSQRQTLSELGVLALVGGSIACFLTGVIAGMLV